MHTAELFDFGPFPTLTTERLVLRDLVDADADDVFVIWGDPEVQKYNAEPLRDVGQAHTLIAEMLAEYAAQRQVIWAMAMRGSGTVVGYRFSGGAIWLTDLGRPVATGPSPYYRIRLSKLIGQCRGSQR